MIVFTIMGLKQLQEEAPSSEYREIGFRDG
jgi:hypothetical protein